MKFLLKKNVEVSISKNLGSTDIEKVLESSGVKLYDSDEDRENNSVGKVTKKSKKSFR